MKRQIPQKLGDLWKVGKREVQDETEEEEKLYWIAIEAASRYLDALENNKRDIPRKFTILVQHILFDHFWDWINPAERLHLKHRNIIRGCYDRFQHMIIPDSLKED